MDSAKSIFLKALHIYRKPLAVFFPSIIMVALLMPIGFAWCSSFNKPFSELMVFDVKYLPVVFTFLKVSVYYTGYLWSLYMFLTLYYYEALGFRYLLKTFLSHTLIITLIALAGIIPSYLAYTRTIETNTLLAYYYLPFIMFLLEAYIVIAVIHSPYVALRRLLPYTSRIEVVRLIILVYVLGFLASSSIGAVLAFYPAVYSSPIYCRAPLYKLEMWNSRILPSNLALLDAYLSPMIRFILIIVFTKAISPKPIKEPILFQK
jgi:hypothetical protein